MKKFKSSDDLESKGGKGVYKDWGKRDGDSGLRRSSSHRSFYYKSESGKKGLSSSLSRYDRLEDDRGSSRVIRKWMDYDVNSYDGRKSYDRYRDGGERRIISKTPPRGGYGLDRIHRSKSFSGLRREFFPKGFRSDRGRSRREGSVSSWRRFSEGKDINDGNRTGGDSGRGSRVGLDELVKVRSPLRLRDTKSPAWSKDSGSKQSKNFEVKKSENVVVGESDSGSEMEEGELEPDPVPQLDETVANDQGSIGLRPNQKALDSEHHVEDDILDDGEKSISEGNIQPNQLCVSDEKTEVGIAENVQNVVKEVDELSSCQNTSIHEISDSENVTETLKDNGDSKDEECSRDNSNCNEEESNALAEESQPSVEEQKEDMGMDFEVKVKDADLPVSIKEVTEGNGESRVALPLSTDEINLNYKDKGKSVVVSPSNDDDSSEDGPMIENESRNLIDFREIDMLKPSIRGFELFFTNSVKKSEKVDQSGITKPKDENLVFEPLELSLSLPNVLLPIGSHCTAPRPNSLSHSRSVQSFASSFRTDSDASMSFSDSQAFTHNPSCSLTHNSFDNYEQSVGSRTIFQGWDQMTALVCRGQSSNDNRNKESPVYQPISSNGSDILHHYQTSECFSDGQAVPVQKLGVAEGNSRIPVGLDRQMSVGSRDTKSECSKDTKRVLREKNGVSLCRNTNQERNKHLLTGEADFVEPIISMLVSEPLHIMARRFNEMTKHSLSCLERSIRATILNPSKKFELHSLQNSLQNRSDITLDTLLKAHRAQLEIMVALKTGLHEFLDRDYDISSSDLAEIFLNLRCINLTCRSLLPVDECDCKICVKKNGFCSACMCLVCLKFDTASNTCSWVGCDVCLHWCHADCGLRESCIRNGASASGAQGTTEMQFHCVACNHPSEMFGFVKEVFQNFAKGWTAETFSRELEYVRRIFCASEDFRGKRLHGIVIQMLSKLANKCNLHEVQTNIMGFLTGSDSFKSDSTPIVPVKELPKKNPEKGSNVIAGSHQETAWLKSVYSEKSPQLEKPALLLATLDYGQNDTQAENSKLQRSAKKEPDFDELESIVRMKHAEAIMFQTRADDARKEAEGLKRLAITKSKNVEEEYMSRISKLHLAEAEEIRRQKFEELQALERAHREYISLKRRMEADIKDLLLKMEATKGNLTL